jgi:polar amino acid transport system substrate-binding protein
LPVKAPDGSIQDVGRPPSAAVAIAADLAPEGVLRVCINLGNPVLAQGTPDAPTGVSVDIAHAIAARLELDLTLRCVDAARKSFEAMTSGDADVCFLAIEPARTDDVAFTAPYVVIDGVYVVPRDSPFTTATDVDRDGVRIGVKQGSAYDLYLTRTLRHASVIRGDDGIVAFETAHLEVAAGIRAPMTCYVGTRPDLRVLEDGFMQIRQAVGTTPAKRPQTLRFLHDLVEELKADGFIADALRRSGQPDSIVAPPA